MLRRATAEVTDLLRDLLLSLEEADEQARLAIELQFGRHPLLDFFGKSPIQHAREFARRNARRGDE